MAKTIDQGFREFNSQLKIFDSESRDVANHRSSILSCLESIHTITNFFKTGSIGHGTNINGYSDTDYFCVIKSDELSSNSSYVLQKLKERLSGRFPGTSIYVDSPAVIVPFGTKASETTEIVPAYFSKSKDGYSVYWMPDRKGGWLLTSPIVHNNYVTAINNNMGLKVKPLVRFLKAWKCYRNVPISSFFIEMFVARYASNESSIIYSYDIKRVLKLLSDNGLTAMQDPTEISGYIYPCSSEYNKADAISKLGTALSRVTNALNSERQGKIEDAFYWWNKLYDENFPSY